MRLSLVFSRRTSMVSFIPPLLHSSFVERLRVPASTRERLQAERVLAVARIIIVLFALVAAHFDPTEPTRYAPIVFGLLVIYASFALAVLALLHIWRLHSSFLLHQDWTGLATAITLIPAKPYCWALHQQKCGLSLPVFSSRIFLHLRRLPDKRACRRVETGSAMPWS